VQLAVENVCKAFETSRGALAILNGVSLELSPGEAVAVVGPSGSGKSTLLNIMGSLEKPTSGSVRLDDVEVTELAGDDLARFRSRQVGFVFQDHHLLPQCTALENVMLPTLTAHATDDAGERAADLLNRVGLAERVEHFPAQLSGGERQRVAIARALVNGAPLLLCDEPTGNLDRDTGMQVGDLFVELADERDVMLVIVTHNLELAGRFSQVKELREGVLTDAEH